MHNCTECRYFSAHYIKCDSGTFYRLSTCGHCISGKMKLKDSLKIVQSCLSDREKDGCEFWQPVEIKIQEREEHITNILSHMLNTLQQIAFTLSDDKEILKNTKQ